MKAIRLFGVLCVTAAGLIITRFSGPPELGLAAAGVLAVVGLTLFASRPRKTISLRLPAPAPRAHPARTGAWAA